MADYPWKTPNTGPDQYSSHAAEDERARTLEYLRQHNPNTPDSELQEDADHEINGGANRYHGPGAADVGGRRNGADAERDYALKQKAPIDAQRDANSAALNDSLARMKGVRGDQSVENRLLSQREANSRGKQGAALDLYREAAEGRAPSVAGLESAKASNDLLGGFAGSSGSARGLGGLNGSAGGTAGLGASSTGLAASGAKARGAEIGEALGGYGQLGGQVAGQDLTRLGVNTQNKEFNQSLNDDWKVGNANLAAGQAGLGVNLGATSSGWLQRAQAPADIQFKYDQEMAAAANGANTDSAAAAIAASKEARQHEQQVVGGVVQGGLTAVGTIAGGPAGGAAGGMAGSAINYGAQKYY